ncbi:helix-turn-helix domain-containing protein [Paenibacillus chondroitinus]|uniref:Helix-turn-helix domain-containing protein n=1 Tax=Paenibacillus chondroitinus TaxID=59842 RepID=A0ABU6DLD9_9BACL|nr:MULTISPECIES: helix-turn-helix domain-containing protein [Paenibacillus]MCY9662411.1 helix-turn-helix domain-containing protein [Paenibacillus anseongense]MEB4798596.1 helix-turn-helix domain-containing protein [Paenibacillus chondroitinus]
MKRTIFIRLLLHLTIAVVLITLLVGTLVYRYTDSMLREEVLLHNQELLGQSKKMVEQALGEVKQSAASLALHSDLQKAVWLSWDLEEEYRFLKNTEDLLTERINSSTYLDSIYLYSAQNQKLISSSGITDLQQFSYKQGVQQFMESKHIYDWQAVHLEEGDHSVNVMTFLFSVPIWGIQKKGAILMNLKEDVLYSAVVNSNNRKLGNVAILNQEGEVLSYKDKSMLLSRFNQADIQRIQREKEGSFTEKINGQDTLVSFLTSDANGWIYLTLNPSEEVFKKSHEVIRVTLLISYIAFSLGMLMMIIVSIRYYKPVRKTVHMISTLLDKPFSKMHDRDEFSYIGDSVNRLYVEKEAFKEKFRGQELVIRDHVVLSLLSGKTNDDELMRQMQYYELDLDQTHFIVLVLRIHVDADIPAGPEEQALNLLHFQVRAICEELIAACGKGLYVSQFHSRDVLIMNAGHWGGPQSAYHHAKELAIRLRNRVADELHGTAVTVGIGGKYEKLSEISLSYNEALDALLYERIAGKGSILSISDYQTNHVDRSRFTACRQLVDKLIHELKTWNTDKALQLKDELIERLASDELVGFPYKDIMLTQLLHALMTVRIELCGDEEDGSPDLILAFSKKNSLEQVRVDLDLVIRDIAGRLEGKREVKHQDVVEKLVEYTKHNYREPISLQTLADMALMNSQYVSKLFKEVTGKNFLDYLTETRYNEACRLLEQTYLTINEIAEATGFGQKQNLIRTFKKYCGLTPSEYRNQRSVQRIKG